MNRVAKHVLSPVLLLILLRSGAVFAQDSTLFENIAALSVIPKQIDVSSFFRGTTLEVDVWAPAGYDIAVTLEGQKNPMVFNQKGKKGFLWMNVGEVVIKNAPRVYVLYTSENISKLAPVEELLSLDVGYPALNSHIVVEGNNIESQTILREFYKFQEMKGLYKIGRCMINADSNRKDCDCYSLHIAIPSYIPAGTYGLCVFYFNNGHHIQTVRKEVVVKKVGLTSIVTRLARDHGALYGIIAIVFAIITGFSIGIIFSYMRKKIR